MHLSLCKFYPQRLTLLLIHRLAHQLNLIGVKVHREFCNVGQESGLSMELNVLCKVWCRPSQKSCKSSYLLVYLEALTKLFCRSAELDIDYGCSTRSEICVFDQEIVRGLTFYQVYRETVTCEHQNSWCMTCRFNCQDHQV